jgi:hypothetical protein
MPKNIGLTFARKSECFISKENKKRPPMKKDAPLKKCKELKRPSMKKEAPLKTARGSKDLR